MRIGIDLHNHSCLSTCAHQNMLPSLLALEASERDIKILALTDHNSGRNLPAFAEACEMVGIVGVFGCEVNTIEEVHMLALFEDVHVASDFCFYIESLLPRIMNVINIFGQQTVVDIRGKILEEATTSLYGAANISVDQLVNQVNNLGGMVIPAHIDRLANSLTANLGFVPDLPYAAVEAIRVPCHVEVHGKTVIQGSDAHYLEHIGRRCCYIDADEANYPALVNALANSAIFYRGS